MRLKGEKLIAEADELEAGEKSWQTARIYYNAARDRTAGQKIPQTSFIPLAEQYANNSDLLTKTIDITLNLDFDMMRRPVFETMRENEDELILRVGCVDGDPGIRPVAHIWTSLQAPWFEIDDDLPRLAEGRPPGR